MEVLQIRQAISMKRKKILNNKVKSIKSKLDIMHNTATIEGNILTSKRLYWLLIEQIYRIPKKQNKWEAEYPLLKDNTEIWKKIIKDLFESQQKQRSDPFNI